MKMMLPIAAWAMMVTFAWLAPPSPFTPGTVLAQDDPAQTSDAASHVAPTTASDQDAAPDSAAAAAPPEEPAPDAKPAADAAPELSDEDNFCIQCHGNTDLWEGDTLHLLVTPQMLSVDIHWQKGVRCQQCHGGNASTLDLRQAHAIEDGFRKINSVADIPQFCGHCHSDADYMKRFKPDAHTDIVARFLASVHGRQVQAALQAQGAAKKPAADSAAAGEEAGGEEADAADASQEDEAADAEPAAADPTDAQGTVPMVTCASCHVPHHIRPLTDPDSSFSPRNLPETCGACHRDQLVALRKSVHAKAGAADETGAGTLLDCTKCHGQDVHGMLPVSDNASPVRLENQVQRCGDCHEKYQETYLASVHGKGLMKSGLIWSAVCADCHGAHGIYYAADRRSTLHPSNAGTTCGKCHHYLVAVLAQSVHGEHGGLGTESQRAAPGGIIRRRPSCTDCHQGHDVLEPGTEAFRHALPNRCGNCHARLADRYRLSLHGELTEFGYEPAAECADCHGAHDILPLDNPKSRMAVVNREKTCRNCHQFASANFAKFDPHASYKDAAGYPVLHGLYSWLEFIIYVLVGMFALHMLFWFTRSFFHARRFGRDRPCVAASEAIRCFVKVDRVIYLLLIISFVGLVLSGLPLKYGHYSWAKRVAATIGGFQTTSVWHRAFALTLLVCCGVHLSWLIRYVLRRRREHMAWRTVLFGPDSPVPNGRDLRDFLGMLRWFSGLGNKPRFERWAYWEKLDYWAVYGGMAIIGLSGLMLWFPNLFCLILPGTVLNSAKVVHSEVVLAVAGFVFMIHVFNTHLRPEKFPLDVSWFTGVVSEQHLRRSRPDFLRRMHAEGKLDAMRTVAPPKARLRWIYIGAFLLLALALCVLFIIVVVSLGV